MKKIEAIIRREMLEPVKQAMTEIGYPGMTITDVKGHGKQRGISHQWRGKEYKVEFLPKVKLEIVVLDGDLGKTLSAIVRKARTGETGDGKIFVTTIEEAIRIRTGEAGEDAI